MNAGSMKVSFGALEAAANDIRGGANRLQSRLDQLDRELAPLRSDWTGAAAEGYQAAKAKWSTAITEMQQMLAQLGSSVGNSNTDYQGAESGNAGRWN